MYNKPQVQCSVCKRILDYDLIKQGICIWCSEAGISQEGKTLDKLRAHNKELGEFGVRLFVRGAVMEAIMEERQLHPNNPDVNEVIKRINHDVLEKFLAIARDETSSTIKKMLDIAGDVLAEHKEKSEK